MGYVRDLRRDQPVRSQGRPRSVSRWEWWRRASRVQARRDTSGPFAEDAERPVQVFLRARVVGAVPPHRTLARPDQRPFAAAWFLLGAEDLKRPVSKPTTGLNTRHVPPTSGSSTRTLGVDLASQPALTAVCLIEWTAVDANIRLLHVDVDDAEIIQLASGPAVAKVGIDAPFGWPARFVEAVSEYAHGRWPDVTPRQLAFRTCDQHVRETTGRLPLSVSSDRIAYAAMRCAGLLTTLSGDAPIDRTGSGLAVEVYPAAALRQWGLPATGYKGASETHARVRSALVRAVVDATSPWLRVSAVQAGELERNDHLLDAVLAALVARATLVGATLPVPEEHRLAAAIEGWIQLPLGEPLASFRPWRRRASR